MYVRRQWQPVSATGRRPTYGLVGANMSFRRGALVAIGGFDEAFMFGAEGLEVCLRLAGAHPRGGLIFDERPQVLHHFQATLRDVLRRSRSYGIGSARLYRRRGRPKPTLFPLPFVLATAVVAGLRWPKLRVLVPVLPLLWFPRGVVALVGEGSADALIDPYVKTLEETAGDIGVIQGLWRYRDAA
jgi:hypothetical protein